MQHVVLFVMGVNANMHIFEWAEYF